MVNKLKKKLDNVFAKYYKRNAPKNHLGQMQCYINKTWHYKLELCHYMDRGFQCTRWDEENCKLCSLVENRFEPNHKAKFRKALVEDIGEERVIALEERSLGTCKVNEEILLNLINKYT